MPLEDSPCPSAPSPQAVQEWLVTNLAATAGVAPAQIDVRLALTSMGIESLMLFSLAGELASWLGRDIETTLLWEYPTVEALAAHLGHNDAIRLDPQASKPQLRSKPASLVAIQPLGTHPPFFVVHEVSGTVWCYAAMARHLGEDQPFYGFQVPLSEVESESAPDLDSLIALAATYVAELRAHQPRGPYFLGGFSLGGVIAFEMARQLREQEQEIALLALIDTYFPGLARSTPSLSRKIRIHARNLRGLEPAHRLHYLQARLQKRVPNVPQAQGETPEARARHLLLQSQVSARLEAAFRTYRAPPYAGRITLLRAQGQFSSADDSRRWRGVALGGVQHYFVPGSHGLVVAEPYVRHLAARLKQCLHQARTAPSP